MGFRSTLDSLLQALIEGVPFDMASGESIKFLPAVNDRGSMEIGNATVGMDLKVWLGAAGGYVLFNTGDSKLTLSSVTLEGDGFTMSNATFTGNTALGNTAITGTTTLDGNTTLSNGTLTGANHLSTRYELQWTAGERGLPGIPADATSNTISVLAATDPMFEITGTNSASAQVTVLNTGGILLTTAGADDDQMILGPHTTASLSGWKSAAWNTAKSPEWECRIQAGADIVNSIIWAGLKLTDTPVVTTDINQVYFRYETTANAGAWTFVSSINNVDTVTNTGIAVANAAPFHLKIAIDSSRIARAYINGTLVHTTAALITNIDLLPFIGVQTTDVAAASLAVRGQAISKAF